METKNEITKCSDYVEIYKCMKKKEKPELIPTKELSGKNILFGVVRGKNIPWLSLSKR